MRGHPPALLAGSHRQHWVQTAFLLGATYFLIGRLFGLPTSHVRAWRFAAWVASGAAYGAHIGYEHFTRRNPPRMAALHVAVGVAIGAGALAIAGMLSSWSTTSAIRPSWLLALVLWPAFTAIPAFVVALVAAAVLARRSRTGME